MLRRMKYVLLSVVTAVTSLCSSGCGKAADDGKTVIELVHYKPEAVSFFEEMEEKFNKTHNDIELKISSPNVAMPG